MADEFSYSAKDLYGDYGYGEEGVTFSALDAIIRNLKVSSAQIEKLAVTDAHIKNVSVEKLVAGSFNIDANNLLFNATWGGNTLGWDMTGARDTSVKFKGYNSIKVEQSGNVTPVWRGAWQYDDYAMTSLVGETWTASVYVMTDDWYTFDNVVAVELIFLDSANNRIDTYSETWFPDVNNEWTRINITASAPSNTAKVKVSFWVGQNGRAWFACPMLQRGQFLTEFTPNGTYIGPNGIMTSDITFTGKLQGADISGATGTFSGSVVVSGSHSGGNHTAYLQQGRVRVNNYLNQEVELTPDTLIFRDFDYGTLPADYETGYINSFDNRLNVMSKGSIEFYTNGATRFRIDEGGTAWYKGRSLFNPLSGTARCIQYHDTRLKSTVNHSLGALPNVQLTAFWVTGAESISKVVDIYVENVTASSFDIQVAGSGFVAGGYLDVMWIAYL